MLTNKRSQPHVCLFRLLPPCSHQARCPSLLRLLRLLPRLRRQSPRRHLCPLLPRRHLRTSRPLRLTPASPRETAPRPLRRHLLARRRLRARLSRPRARPHPCRSPLRPPHRRSRRLRCPRRRRLRPLQARRRPPPPLPCTKPPSRSRFPPLARSPLWVSRASSPPPWPTALRA